MDTNTASLTGQFIVFDGPDGSGKSTQINRFVQRYREEGLVVKEVREPGGSSIGEQIRNVLLDPINEEMTLPCEMLLYMASRAQLVEQEIRPAMERGELVVADRFVSATLAYQGTGGGFTGGMDTTSCRSGCCWVLAIIDIDSRCRRSNRCWPPQSTTRSNGIEGKGISCEGT